MVADIESMMAWPENPQKNWKKKKHKEKEMFL
jgi:hypothetical protein